MLWHLNCFYALMLIISLSPVHCVQKRAIDLNEVADFEDIIEQEGSKAENTVSNSLKKIEAIELELPESLKTVLSLSNVSYGDFATTKKDRRRQAILTTQRPNEAFDAPKSSIVDNTDALLKFKMRQMKTRVLPNFLTGRRRRRRRRRYVNLSPLLAGGPGRTYLGNLAAATNDAYLKMQNYAATMVILITTKRPSEFIFTQAIMPKTTTETTITHTTTSDHENSLVHYKSHAVSDKEYKRKPGVVTKKLYDTKRQQKMRKHPIGRPVSSKHHKTVGGRTTISKEIDDALLMADTFGSMYAEDKKQEDPNRNYRKIYDLDEQLNSFATIPSNMHDLLRVYQTPITESRPHEIEKPKDLPIAPQRLVTQTKSGDKNIHKENIQKQPFVSSKTDFPLTAVRTTNPYSWENDILKEAKVKFKKNAMQSTEVASQGDNNINILNIPLERIPSDSLTHNQPKPRSQSANPKKIIKVNPAGLAKLSKLNEPSKHTKGKIQQVHLQKHSPNGNDIRPYRVLPQKVQQSKQTHQEKQTQKFATTLRAVMQRGENSSIKSVAAQVRDIQTTGETTEAESSTMSLPFIFTKSLSEHIRSDGSENLGLDITTAPSSLPGASAMDSSSIDITTEALHSDSTREAPSPDSSTVHSDEASISSDSSSVSKDDSNISTEATGISSEIFGNSTEASASSDSIHLQNGELDCDKLLEKEANLFNKAADCDKEIEDEDKGTGGFEIPTKEDAEKFLKMNLRNTNATDENGNLTTISANENSQGGDDSPGANNSTNTDIGKNVTTPTNPSNEGCDSHDDDDSDTSCDEGIGEAPYIAHGCDDSKSKQKVKKIKPKHRSRRQVTPTSSTPHYTLIKIPSANIPILPQQIQFIQQPHNNQIRAIEPSASILPPVTPVTALVQNNNSIVAKKSLDRNTVDTVIENLKTVDQKLAEAVEPLHSAQEALDSVTKCEASTTPSCDHVGSGLGGAGGSGSGSENNVLADISDAERTALQKLAHKIINSSGSSKFKRSGAENLSNHKQHTKPSRDSPKIEEKKFFDNSDDYYDMDDLNQEMKRLQRDLIIANELETIMKEIKKDSKKIEHRRKREDVDMETFSNNADDIENDEVLRNLEKPKHSSKVKNDKQKKEYTGLFIPGDNDVGIVSAYKKQNKSKKKKKKKKKGSIWNRLFGKRDPDEDSNRFLNQGPQNSQYIRQ